MSADTFTNWLKFTPATQPGYRKAYLDLPAFSYTGLDNETASYIATQFNFTATKNFILLNKPSKPLGVNYGLCIRYRVGETIYRYKLWEDASFVLNDFTTPLYTNQIIRKNFVLEVWVFAGATAVSQTAAIRMFSSIRALPTDITVTTAYALAVGTEFNSLANTDPVLPSGATQRWTNFSSITGATDVIGGNVLTEFGPGVAPIAYTAADASFLRGYANFPDDSTYLRNAAIPGTWNAYTVYLVFALLPLDVSLSRDLVGMTDASFSGDFLVTSAGLTNKIRCSGDAPIITPHYDLTIPDTGPHILKVAKVLNGDIYGRIDELASGSIETATDSISSMHLQLGGFNSSPQVNQLKLAEALFFNGSSFADGDANDLQVLQYLRWYHFGEIPIPMTFNAAGPWLDNA